MIGHLEEAAGMQLLLCDVCSTSFATDEYNSLSGGRSLVACLAHCWTHWSLDALDELECKQWNVAWNDRQLYVLMMHYHTTRLVNSTLRVPTCCVFLICSTWWAVIVRHFFVVFVQWKCLTCFVWLSKPLIVQWTWRFLMLSWQLLHISSYVQNSIDSTEIYTHWVWWYLAHIMILYDVVHLQSAEFLYTYMSCTVCLNCIL